MKALCVLAVALFAAMTAGTAGAADAIKIGVIYPLTGNAASAGSPVTRALCRLTRHPRAAKMAAKSGWSCRWRSGGWP